MTVPNAGHFVPAEATKAFLLDYFAEGKLSCHAAKEADCSTKNIMCKFMNNCSSNGECLETGLCKCNPGFRGADCSQRDVILEDFFDTEYTFNGTQWLFFSFAQELMFGETFEFTLSSTTPMEVYMLKGANADVDPNEFNHDIAFKQQTFVKFGNDMFPSLATFVAAVRVNGINFYQNQF